MNASTAKISTNHNIIESSFQQALWLLISVYFYDVECHHIFFRFWIWMPNVVAIAKQWASISVPAGRPGFYFTYVYLLSVSLEIDGFSIFPPFWTNFRDFQAWLKSMFWNNGYLVFWNSRFYGLFLNHIFSYHAYRVCNTYFPFAFSSSSSNKPRLGINNGNN